MIQAQELRLGNYIRFATNTVWSKDYAGKVCIVAISDLDELNKGKSHYYEPIPLSPELLEKCGFVLEEEGAYNSSEEKSYPLYRSKISVVNRDGQFSLWIEMDDNWYSFAWTKISYLHQFQNLYYALVGEELPLTL